MHGPRLMLIHSPLTGPSFWSGVRDALWRMGLRSYLGRLPAADRIHPPYWLTHAAGVAATLPEDGEVVLVGHSGAGPLLPAIGRLARNREYSARIAGYLFVDSDLPRDACSRLDLFDDQQAAQRLRERCRGGLLPPLSESQLDDLLPNPAQRAQFLAALPDTPLAVYEELISVPDDWPEAPCGYLQLSAHYPGSVGHARAAGWPLVALAGHHLLPLTEPQRVAESLVTLSAALTSPDRQCP